MRNIFAKYRSLSAGLIILLGSCATSRVFEIEVLKPARTNVPHYVTNVAFANTDAACKADTSISILTAALSQFVSENERYINSIDKGTLPVSGKDFHFDFNSDSIDLLVLFDSLSITVDSATLKVWDNDLGNLYVKTLHTYTSCHAVMQYATSPHRLKTFSVNDTLLVEEVKSSNGKRSYSDPLPSLAELKRQAMIHAATRLESYFVPYWTTEERVLFIFYSNELQEAQRLVNENRWQDAQNIWEDCYAKEKSASAKARLALNIALANEMNDNLLIARRWIEIATDLLPKSNTNYTDDLENSTELNEYTVAHYYRTRINTRITDNKLLDKQ